MRRGCGGAAGAVGDGGQVLLFGEWGRDGLVGEGIVFGEVEGVGERQEGEDGEGLGEHDGGSGTTTSDCGKCGKCKKKDGKG